MYFIKIFTKFFTEKDYTLQPFEKYSELDSLGRCGVAFANIGKDIMPTEPRGEIGMIKPSGWQYAKYDYTLEQVNWIIAQLKQVFTLA